ncbi:peptide deformylase [Desulfogranum japonicum]|uniref:peptide deformylase n=1 Tax=Desulfogranum japonicum TaxID=231447 RepID=UPI002FC3DB97
MLYPRALCDRGYFPSFTIQKMAIREIITLPHPVLRQQAEEITLFDDDLKKLAQDMGETMYAAPGVGLAANQIGITKRIVVVDISENDDEKKFITLVNPVISNGEGSVIDEEGCLSVLEYQAKVKRFQKIHVTAQNIDGTPMEFDAEDRFARIIQHEVDHLDGALFIDHLSSLKRAMYKKKLKKILQREG